MENEINKSIFKDDIERYTLDYAKKHLIDVGLRFSSLPDSIKRTEEEYFLLADYFLALFSLLLHTENIEIIKTFITEKIKELEMKK